MNEGRYPLELICPVGGEADPKGRVPGPCTEDSTSTHHSITHPGQASVNRIAAFHYITRSWEDYEVKMTRQFSVTRGPEFFDHVQRCAARLAVIILDAMWPCSGWLTCLG